MPTVEEPEPTEPEPAAVEEPARMVEPAPAPAPATTGATPEARVAALLGPSLGTLTVDTVAMDGTMLVVAAAPSLTRADVVETAVRVLPFLTDGRLPAPADQLTVRSHESAVVITPLGPDATLATVPASSTSLALLERLALRASVQMGSDGVRHRPAAAPGEADGMQAVSVPRHVEALAASLQAFGRVTPTVLRDAEGVLLYLFLPSHLDARRLGAFARDLARALTGAALGDMAAATVRFGSQCVVIRTAGGSVARTTLLVTGGGPTARPGLARLELERAALRLGTL
jgi:predicted regulator of Ras-like GTPase activity (Roadblock/LC7/MglB family)